MSLKAIKPELVKETKPKFMVSGKSGVGKTWFSLDFPRPYLIDCESGANREQYVNKLLASGGAYFGKEQGSHDFKTVIEEVIALATTPHDYKTLVIDSFSHLYNTAAAIAEEKMGSDFGRDKKEANRPTRTLMRWIESLPMTVILICHLKDKWERRGKDIINSGTTFDGFDKLEYILDLWIEIQKTGPQRNFIVKKSRIESLPDGKEFDCNYKKFSEIYGKEILEEKSIPINLATPQQIEELTMLLETLKIPEETVEKWKTKADVDSFEEMTEQQILACISFCKKKLDNLNKEEK